MDKINYVKISACILAAMMIAPAGLLFTTTNDQIIIEPAAGVVDDSVDTIVIQPDATAGKDAWIGDLGGVDTNNGASTNFQLGLFGGSQEVRNFWQMDMPTQPIEIIYASLDLYCYALGGGGVNISGYPATQPWIENEVTWNNRDAGNLWTTPGGDYDLTREVYMDVDTTGCWYSFDITDIVNDWQDNIIPNYGLVFVGNYVVMEFARFYSSDYVTDITLRPKLTLTYSAEIEPPVPDQIFNENDPARTISLAGLGNGSVEHKSGSNDAASGYPFNPATQLHYQSLFTPDMVGAEGVISKISINRSDASAVGNYSNFKILLAHTDLNVLTTTFANNFNGNQIEVFSEANVVMNSSNGDSWIHFDLNDEFTYDSSYNLLVDIQYYGRGGDTVTSDVTTGGSRMWSTTGATTAASINTNTPSLIFTTDVVNNAIIDNGTTNNGALWDTGNTYNKFMLLYQAPDLNNKNGTIDKIGFFKSNAATPTFPNVTVSLAHTDRTSSNLSTTFSNNYIGTLMEVYNNPSYTFDASTGWFQFDLDNDFEYDGTHNLIVQVEWRGTATGADALIERGMGTGTNWIETDVLNSLTGSTNSRYYDIQLIFSESDDLTWTAYSSDPDLFDANISADGKDLIITPVADMSGEGIAYLNLTNTNNGGMVTQNIPVTIIENPKIEPPVPAQVFQEDDPARTIDLTHRDNDMMVHESGLNLVANGVPFLGGATNQMRSQFVYTPEQVGAEGIIKTIAFNNSWDITDTGTYDNFQVKMAHTSLDALTATFANNYNGYLIEVFPTQNITVDFPGGDSWFELDLNDNFTYDSSHNLLIDIVWNGDNGTNIYIDTTNGIPGGLLYNTAGAGTGTIQANSPVFKFTTEKIGNAIKDSGTTNNGLLWDTGQTYTKFQMLYKASELDDQKGTIDKIGFYKTNTEDPSFPNVTISLAHTDLDALTGTYDDNYIGSLTDVYYNLNYTFDASSGWIQFDLDDTFYYNGTDNLLVQVEWNGTAYGADAFISRGPDIGTNWVYTFTSGSSTGTTDSRYYNTQIIFTEKMTWSAIGSDPSLFTTVISGENLIITPVAEMNGVGSIGLTLTRDSDGIFDTQTIPVTINAVNDPPIITGPITLDCIEDIEVIVNVISYISDIDDALEDLTISEDSDYATVDETNITFLYTEGIVSEDVIITVTDMAGATDTVTLSVTITPINDAPEFTNFVDNITCDADMDFVYTPHPVDEETVTGQLTIYTNSGYATLTNHSIRFNYPKGIGSENVTIYLVDEDIYGTQNNVSYTLMVTVNDYPEVIGHTPSGVDVPVTTLATVTFDMPMDANTTENAFEMSIGNSTVLGNFSWNGDHTILTFTPDDALGNGVYDVIVRASAENSDGVSMRSAYSWSFNATLGDYDGDGDGMPDQYEIDNGLDPDVDDSDSDLDGDGMPNIYEFENELDPAVDDADDDADGDGMPNIYEFENDLDPNVDDADGDADGDGISNLDEFEAGTSSSDPDDNPDEPMNWLPIILLLVIVIVAIVLFFMLKNKKDKPEDMPPAPEGEEWNAPEEGTPPFEEGQFQEQAPPPQEPVEPMNDVPAEEPVAPVDDQTPPPPPPPPGEVDPSEFITE